LHDRAHGVARIPERGPRSWLGVKTSLALSSKAEQRKEVSEVSETLGFGAFIIRQRLAEILLVEQRVKPSINPLWKRQSGELPRKLNVDVNSCLPSHAQGSLAFHSPRSLLGTRTGAIRDKLAGAVPHR
jgi:hypothetical protein